MSSAAQRISQLSNQTMWHVFTVATRTALTKAKKGHLKDTQLEGLLVPLLKRVKELSRIDPGLVEEIVVGNVLHKDAPFVVRASAVAAGYPPTTSISTVAAGSIDIGIALGAESMSNNPDKGAPEFPSHFMENPTIRDIVQPMPWTSENVARDFGVTREKQDEFAAASFQRAEAAQKSGYFAEEITPVRTTWVDPKTGEAREVMANQDGGIRSGTTKESLSKIRAAFPQWPPATTTGGNASQVTDGAAAVLVTRRHIAEKLMMPVLGKFVQSTIAGLEPRIMGVGPTIAIPKLLSKVGISINDVDIFEINEAFASMLVYCVEELGLDPARVNPRGGAIALGHPLGCTGARQIVTALSELKRTRKRIAVTSMCIGSGMGMASLIVSEQ